MGRGGGVGVEYGDRVCFEGERDGKTKQTCLHVQLLYHGSASRKSSITVDSC